MECGLGPHFLLLPGVRTLPLRPIGFFGRRGSVSFPRRIYFRWLMKKSEMLVNRWFRVLPP